MELSEVQALTDEELRIKVAEFCHWTNLRIGCDWGSVRGVVGTVPQGYSSVLVWQHHKNPHHNLTPNYPCDLNACDEMENSLNDEQLDTMFDYLCQIMPTIFKDGVMQRPYGRRWRASARQRCEAFVLTMTQKKE